MTQRLLVILLLLVFALPGAAHEVRPGYLEITETTPEQYSVLWKIPMKGDAVLRMSPVLPDACIEQMPPTSRAVTGAMIRQWTVVCAGGLTGGLIVIEGLQHTLTDVLVRLTHSGGTTQTVRLTPQKTGFHVSGEPSTLEVIETYFELGVEHILLGIDHLLFVMALLFLVRNWPRLIGTVTAFTVAHSLTLAAATLGWVQVPQAPVEAVIALSIVFVAAEVLHARQGHPGLAARMPWVVAFVFGLLHGLGFVGALLEVGLPEHAIPLALAFFNIGVEAGQLLFILAFFLLVWVSSKPLPIRPAGGYHRATSPTWEAAGKLSLPAAYLIGTLASFWLIERTYGFWV